MKTIIAFVVLNIALVTGNSQCGVLLMAQTTNNGSPFYEKSIRHSFDSAQGSDNRLSRNASQKEREGVLMVVNDIYGKERYSKVHIIENDGSSIFATDPSGKLTRGMYLITGTSQKNNSSKRLFIR